MVRGTSTHRIKQGWPHVSVLCLDFFFLFFFPGREAKQESKAAILLFPFLDHVLGDKRVSNTNPGFSDYLICFNCSVCWPPSLIISISYINPVGCRRVSASLQSPQTVPYLFSPSFWIWVQDFWTQSLLTVSDILIPSYHACKIFTCLKKMSLN